MTSKMIMFVLCLFVLLNGSPLVQTYEVLSETPKMDTFGNCGFELSTEHDKDHINELIDSTDVIRIKLKLQGLEFTSALSTPVYHPYEWTIVTGLNGRALLMLKEWSVPLSLTSLSVNFKHVDLLVRQQPPDCVYINNLTFLETEMILRRNFLNNFTDNALDGVEICNRHILMTDDGAGLLKYICCNRDVECHSLERSQWVSLLFSVIVIIQVALVLYSPRFLPDSVYQITTKYTEYLFQPDSNQNLHLVIRKLHNIEQVDKDYKRVEIAVDRRMEALEKVTEDISPGVHSLKVKSVVIGVKQSKILLEGHSPVGLLQFLKYFVGRCGIRNDVESLKSCCFADIFNSLPCVRVHLMWYTVLVRVSSLFMSLFATAPFILRIIFYYVYEREYLDMKESAFKRLKIKLQSEGNAISELGPFHPLFVFCYMILLLDVVVMLFLSDHFKDKLKFTIRQCFIAMLKTDVSGVFGEAVSVLISPLRKYGLLGCLVIPVSLLLLPVSLFILLVRICPLTNVVLLRIIPNLLYNIQQTLLPHFDFGTSRYAFVNRLSAMFKSVIVKDYHDERNHVGWVTVFALIMSLVSIGCILLLWVECILFYTECFIYILIGLILNSEHLMKYVTILLLILFYGLDCFGSVYTRFVTFNKLIFAEIRKRLSDKIEDVAKKSSDEQPNMTFALTACAESEEKKRMHLVGGRGGYLRWDAARIVLFLSRNDILYIPKHLLFKASKLPHFGCPGPVHMRYMSAMIDFGRILVFLAFVLLIIMAFSHHTGASSTHQILATLAGGFIPFALRKFLIKSESPPQVDTDSLVWKGILESFLQTYTKRWTISDIIVEEHPRNNDESVDASEKGRNMNIMDDNILVDIIMNVRSAGLVEYYVHRSIHRSEETFMFEDDENVLEQTEIDV